MTVRRRQISSRACRSANCVSEAVIDFWCNRRCRKPLCQNFSGSRSASQCQCSCGSCGYDVVMTPTDQAQQDEDANLRKIVAQLHVNLGHPSNDALARAIRLSGGSDDAIQAALKVRCTVCERLTEPSLVLAASHHWRKLFVFEYVGHGQSLPSCFSDRRQKSLDGFLRIPPWLVSHAWCS